MEDCTLSLCVPQRDVQDIHLHCAGELPHFGAIDESVLTGCDGYWRLLSMK